MLVTVILSLVLMAGLFLMLWSAVAFIQDKRFFSSAPKRWHSTELTWKERHRIDGRI